MGGPFVELDPYDSIKILIAAAARRSDIVPSWGVLRSKSVLLHGPGQSGKLLSVTHIANTLKLKVVTVTGWRLVLGYTVQSWPDKAFDSLFFRSDSSPFVLVIKDIEVLFPFTDNEGGGSNDTVFTNSLISQFLSHLDRISKEDDDIIIIGITNKIDKLNPTIRSRFEDEIEFSPPTPSQRLQLLSQHIKNISTNSILETTEENTSNTDNTDNINANKIIKNIYINLNEIETHTHGYMPGDIAALVRDSALSALSRTTQGEAIDLRTSDFVKISKSHPPQNLSGLALQGIPKTMFSDIGGLDSVKAALRDVVVWANELSETIQKLNITPPRGVLLYGPPGTGKTMLARAVAHEARANFISVNISDLSQSEVGESEKALKAVFRRANQSRPSVIFLDEVQALFTARAAGKSHTLHSQLVQCLDWSGTGVLLLAASNCPQAIDPAILRPGRLDLALFVPPPTLEGRKEILTKAISKLQVDETINVDKIAEESDGFTGADLNNLCNTAGLMAMRESIEKGNAEQIKISQAHLEKVLQNTLPSVTQAMVDELKYWEANRK